jgi:hypothetical protein
MVRRRALIQENPDRWIGAGMISPFDVQDAAAERRRCVKELGLRGVFLRPNEVIGRNRHAPYNEPLWTAVALCRSRTAAVDARRPLACSRQGRHEARNGGKHPEGMLKEGDERWDVSTT